MAFQTTSFRETQAELEWDVFWDGSTGSVLREDRSFWVTSAEMVFGPPDANGARAVLGLDVTAHHKQGPHLDATNPAPSVSLRMDPPQILSEAATSDIARGRQTARHATARGAHKDSFDLFTARLVGQSGVTSSSAPRTTCPHRPRRAAAPTQPSVARARASPSSRRPTTTPATTGSPAPSISARST